MKNKTIDLGIVKRIAVALESLNERVVYVGGAVVSLYADDPAADDVRPTKDIDITLEIASLAELEDLREELAKKGFHQSHEDNVMCRFRFQNEILVDVMSTKNVGWAPANPWFGPGFENLEFRMIDGQQIQVLPYAYFLASKFAAYLDRGKSDPRTSKDFEDIAFLLDNRIELVSEIRNSPEPVREYLIKLFKEILNNSTLQEAILAHLFYETQQERYEMMREKLEKLLHSD